MGLLAIIGVIQISCNLLQFFPLISIQVAPNSYHDWPTNTIAESNNAQIHMITVTDSNFALRYGPFFDKMKSYAAKWGYEWVVLKPEDYSEETCPNTFV